MRRQNLQKAMDSRLSGLAVTPRLRAAIRLKTKGEKPMKKKMTLGLVLALALILLLAGVAVALDGNLFTLFSKNDPKSDPALAYVAEHAVSAAPPSGEAADTSRVAVDSAYFDGINLFLAYRVKGGAVFLEPYTPSEEELQSMEVLDYVPVFTVTEKTPVLAAFASSVQAKKAAGYHSASFSRKDSMTANGVDVSLCMDASFSQGDDLLGYLQFETPLPIKVAQADAFTMELTLYPFDVYVWFDGSAYYAKQVTGEPFTVAADIQKSQAPAVVMTGKGNVNGAPVSITATVTPVSIHLAYTPTKDLVFVLTDPGTGREIPYESAGGGAGGYDELLFPGLGYVPQSLAACPITYVYPYPGNMETQDSVYLKEQTILLTP